MKKAIKSQEVDIRFHGNVVDQSGQPVHRAEVELHVRQYDPGAEFLMGHRRILVETDIDGMFALKTRGIAVYLKQVKKDGYEYIRTQNPLIGFDYSPMQARPYIPNPQRPEVFRIRRRGKPAFVLLGTSINVRFSPEESGDTKTYDVMGRTWEKHRSTYGPGWYPDLGVHAVFDEDAQNWTITLGAGDDSGIIASDDLLYEAPEVGYEKEWSYVAAGYGPPDKKYFYLRSREPALYSRIEITSDVRAEKHCRWSFGTVTNPYGERDLEQTPLPSALRGKLEKEAREAFRVGGRPEAPDLPRLIQMFERSTD